MSQVYSRRDVLRMGLSLGAASLAGCGDEAAFGFGGHGRALESSPPLDGYKALVCVFLHGGNDAYNTIVPITPGKREPYERARLNLALAPQTLVPLQGVAPDGAQYGIPQPGGGLATLFNSGRLAVIGNVGPLVAPVTRDDFLAGRDLPARLFSHNDQQDQWHTSEASGAGVRGWAGRAADVLAGANGDAELPLNLTLAGSNLLQRGANSAPFAVSSHGPVPLHWAPEGSSLRATYDRLRTGSHPHVFEGTYASIHDRALRLNRRLADALQAAPALATAFPGSWLGVQLQMAARLIAVRAQLGMRRQVFYVAYGGFDTHDAQDTRHPALLSDVAGALDAFYRATVEMGVDESVTAFTASDFGRSLTVNGKGTDHGWASHQLVVGGAVRGGQYYGSMPSLVPDGADDSRGGRFIPGVAIEEYAAPLVKWLGVPDGNLEDVLPNLGRFATRGLGFL